MRVFNDELALFSLNDNNNAGMEILKIEQLKKNSEKGVLFSRGRSVNKSNEIHYKKVIAKYKKEKKEGLRPSFSKIAKNYARKEMNLIHDIEQDNFYKSCHSYYLKTKK